VADLSVAAPLGFDCAINTCAQLDCINSFDAWPLFMSADRKSRIRLNKQPLLANFINKKAGHFPAFLFNEYEKLTPSA